MARGLLHPLVLLVGWGGGGEQNTLLDNRCLNMRDWLRTSSVLLTSHHNYSKQRRKKGDFSVITALQTRRFTVPPIPSKTPLPWDVAK